MKRYDFLKTLLDDLEIETSVEENTKLSDIDEWDSLAAVTALALFNKKLGLKIKASDMESCKTMADILDLGKEKYVA